MEIRYNRWVAGLLLAGGLINLFLGVWLLLLGSGVGGSLILGVLISVIGVLYFTRPYFTIAPGVVEMKAMIGPLKRTFPFSAPEGLRLEEQRLVAYNGAERKVVPVRRWMARAEDWQALEARTAAAAPSA